MIIKGFITNLGKYNEGELIGKWIEFPIADDEFQEVMKEIGCNYYDEDGNEHITGYEEYFFTDWETDFDSDFGEYESIDRMNEIAENLDGWDEDTFNAACEIWDIDEVMQYDSDDFILHSNVDDNYDLGYLYAVECCCVDFQNNETLKNYFDFEAYGRDIAYEVNGGFTQYGFIEKVA